MKRLITICAVMGWIFVVAGVAQGTIWTVDAGGSGDYTTIQEAVNAAISGDTINVLAGTYDMNPTHTQAVVHVDKSLTIQGSGPGTKIVDGGDPYEGGFEKAFNVVANNVTIRGFSVTATYHGIWLESSSNSLIEDNIVYGAIWGGGIALDDNGSSYGGNVIRGNTVYNNFTGISLLNGSDNLVENNTVYNSNNNGIIIDTVYGGASSNNSIIGNTLYSNGQAYNINVAGEGFFSNITIAENDISDAYRGICILSGVDASAFSVNLNNIVGNPINFLASNDGDGTLNAKCNWWGDPTGPDPSYIFGDVDVSTWLDAPYPDGNCVPEPATIVLFGLGSLVLLRKKTRA